jgi:hypothetical protein
VLLALVSLFLIKSAVGSMVNKISSAMAGLFGGSQSDMVKVTLDGVQKKGEDTSLLSDDNIKKETFQLIK